MKRYYYILWRRVIYGDNLNWNIIDCDPADWLINKITVEDKEAAEKLSGFPSTPVIINQFEITAEQYAALEAIQ